MPQDPRFNADAASAASGLDLDVSSRRRVVRCVDSKEHVCRTVEVYWFSWWRVRIHLLEDINATKSVVPPIVESSINIKNFCSCIKHWLVPLISGYIASLCSLSQDDLPTQGSNAQSDVAHLPPLTKRSSLI
jgi:hypothetical protein